MLTAFVTWTVDPDIIHLGSFKVRYYGLLFALGFYIGYIIYKRILVREKLPMEWLDKLLMYMMIGTVIGARLGHCLFYQPDYYLANPLEILKVWEGGLASHGGAFGILIALYLFSKRVSKKSMLWVLDRIVITVALAAVFIRTGNLMNSEIYGNATMEKSGFVYLLDTQFASVAQSDENKQYITGFDIVKTDEPSPDGGRSWPAELQITYAKNLRDQQQLDAFTRMRLKPLLLDTKKQDGSDANVYTTNDAPVNVVSRAGAYVASIPVFVVPKHPTHIYEALCYLFGFILLWWLYFKTNTAERKGVLFGIFLIITFLSRFLIEFIKENQVEFESGMQLNMGQWLSIPFVIAGVYFIVNGLRKPAV